MKPGLNMMLMIQYRMDKDVAMKLEGQVALITGAGGDIGRSVAGNQIGTGRVHHVRGPLHSTSRSSVNGINPGWEYTDMPRAFHPVRDPEWSSANDIARAALYLAADAPPDMTGQFIDIFGS